MDEELSIISSNTRQEKIKNFFIQNKIKLISLLLIVFLVLICFFGYGEIKKRQQISLSNQFNMILIEFDKTDIETSVNKLVDLIYKKDPTYSPLSLYFIIDNELISDNEKINSLFDILIQKTSLEKEIKNLVILKKALFNADVYDEGNILRILNPIINSDSVWKSHALHLIAEFFYFKDEKQKAKEFFNQIVNLADANPDIKLQAQKRLNRDLSE
jgi:predicted negative regulator of RcsB-dependent stress response